MLPAQASRLPWISSVTMPSYAVLTPPLLDSAPSSHRVQQTLSLLLRHAGILHMVEPQYLRLSLDEGPEFGRGSGLTRHANILLCGWRGDQHCCVDLVGDSPARGGCRDAPSAFATVVHAKRDEHAQTCASHRFDFSGFSVLGSFAPTA